MPWSIQGFGTAFVGQRDFWPDGSYVTTEWYTAFFVPYAPIRSLRVKAGPLRTKNYYVSASIERGYKILDEQPINVRQVTCVYGFLAFYAASLIGLLTLLRPILLALEQRVSERLNNMIGVLLIALILAVPWVVPWYLRERGKRWRPGFK